MQIDVTALVNGWLNGTVPNHGLALTNSDGETAVQFVTNIIGYQPYRLALALTSAAAPTVWNVNTTDHGKDLK